MTLERLEHGAYIHAADPGEPGYEGNPPRISITEREAQILMSIVAGLEVFEIGTGIGMATRAMSVTADSVATCDIDQWVFDNIVPDLPRNVYYEHRDVIDRDIAVSLITPGWDVVFIDGLHTKEAASRDIDLALRFLQPGGRIIFHDTKMESVQAAIKEAGLRLVIEFDTHYGLGVYES